MSDDYKRLVQMIDNCMKNGSAHVNVTTGEEEKVVDKNTTCVQGAACCVPTLHKGIDD